MVGRQIKYFFELISLDQDFLKDFHSAIHFETEKKKKKSSALSPTFPTFILKEDKWGIKFLSICQQEREKWGCNLNGSDPISLSFMLFAAESHVKQGFESIWSSQNSHKE